MRLYFFLALLCWSFWTVGQSDSLVFKRISEEDGLFGNSVKCILQDSRGFLWVGTNVGLNRLDGYEVVVYQHDPEDPFSISDNSINSLYEDSDGYIWIGTESSGLNQYQPEYNQFVRFAYNPADDQSISGDRVQCITEDVAGNIWLGLDDGAGLCKYNKKTGMFTRYDPFSNYPFEKHGQYYKAVRDMSFHPQNPDELWMATILGLMSFDLETEEFEFYPHPSSKSSSRPVGTWCLDWQEETSLRVGFFSIGSDVFDTKSKTWETLHWTINQDFRVLDLKRKSKTQYWVAARKKGLGILDIPTNTYHFPKSDLEMDHTPFPGLTSCLWGDESQLWVGGKYGLSYHNSKDQIFDFHRLPFNSDELGRIVSAVHWKDKMWFGGVLGAGLMEQDSGELLIHLPAGYREMTITGIIPFQDKLLVVENYRKLWWFEKEISKFTPFKLSKFIKKEVFENMYISAYALGSDSVIYFGTTYAGLVKLNLESGELTTYLDEDGHPETSISNHNMITMPDGNIWICSNEGLMIFDPSTEKVSRKILEGMADKRNQRIHAVRLHSNGSIWIAAVNGLIVIEDGKERVFNISNSRIASNFVIEIEFDQLGNAWIGTDKGISFINPDSYEIRNFDRMDGLDYAGHITVLPNGGLIIGSYGGYTQVNTNRLIPRPNQTPVQINSFKVFDKEYPLARHINFSDQVTLSYDDSFFSFSFSKPEFSAPQKVSYAYQLEGFDKDWVMSGARRYASYTNLSGGEYLFKVKAQLVDGGWTPERSLRLIITPPFWLTWWFISFIFVVIFGITYGAYRLRMNYLIREERIKSEFEKKIAEIEMTALRAQMNPHFLFNSLNSINSYIIKNKVHEATAYLTKFSRLIRLILQNSQAHLITLRDELDTVRLYVELEAFRFGDKFSYNFKIDEALELDHIEIPPMIIQPYIENAIWHGLMHKTSTGKLLLSFKKEHRNLIIEIEDDGVGRAEAMRMKSKSATKTKSLGMKITKDRLEVTRKLFGRALNVDIFDKSDESGQPLGTRVVIKLPLE